ncbi:hypothetical protein [Leptolyngbya sp. NIES-2104]|uniref:hypothetical protein n=1 Tax=Leptolyngbya sp. NIES-2104 TaxID=1552121 RepID=UPI0006EC42DA|nr:hypothetical protein [Leptolyngbya sp. NIES-2104]GAP99861.1 hypothetical protein NIES2104_64270 [Leptolyngbya sp. NIES-2104]
MTEQLGQTPTDLQPTSTRASQTSRKTGAKKAKLKEPAAEPTAVKAFDAKQLTRKFKGMNSSEAMLQAMQEDPGQIYTGDDLINALYDEFDATEIPRARKTLDATLMHATRAGTVKRVGDKTLALSACSIFGSVGVMDTCNFWSA